MKDNHNIEQEVLDFWERNKIYEKVREKNKKGKKFYFLQGPPYTSGRIHIGHAWNHALKDMIMRYKRMKGFNVWDRSGYDMHGLPTENKVQEKLGFKYKDQIIEYGIDKFVKECMNFSIEHANYMSEDLWKMGIWMDFKDAYMPIKKEYIDGEWLLFKKADEQGRLYKGKKIMHWDAQSETSLAKHELEYETVKDNSVFLKFKKKGTDNEFFVIWTTTPWTIPFNLAIMVNPEVDYARVKVGDEYWIVARQLAGPFIKGLLDKDYKIVEEFKGDKLEGQEYEHPLHKHLREVYDKLKKESKNVHTVILNKEYVDTSAGTGLVHCAPGCGPEDHEAGQKYGLEAFNTLNEKGEFENLGKYTGWIAKEDDPKFIKEFENLGSLVAKTIVEHEYPHSWRSHKPVVFRPTEQWFLKIEDLIPKLLKFNKKVDWIPKKSGESYERWTENLKDNGLTRQRFWGCPAPIWVNMEDPEDYLIVGSVAELEKHVGRELDDLDLHRPKIDEIIITKGKRKYKRIPDVIDVWIDSGTASWNALYNKKNLIEEYFPADLVLEGNEQTRLWFNMLQICSAIVFGESAYRNVYVHGMILDYEGTKMSKSLGNVISPYEVIDKFSSDVFRYYISGLSAGENANFNWNDVKVKQRNLIILSNIANYILDLERQDIPKGKEDIEEKWILSRYHNTLKKVTELFNEYKLDEVVREIENLYMELSRDYIKLVREKSSENSAVLKVVKEIYIGVLKMFSTVCPFTTESIWRKMKQKEESVHLSGWPEFDKKKINPNLEEKFNDVLKIIEFGLRERDRVKIGLRWPLTKAVISYEGKLDDDLKNIVARQLNVRKIELKKSKEMNVKLDTEMTRELEAEGFSRELSRKVQAERKKAGLQKGDLIELKVYSDKETNEMFRENAEFIKERTNSKKVDFIDGEIKESEGIVFTVKERQIKVFFS